MNSISDNENLKGIENEKIETVNTAVESIDSDNLKIDIR